MTTNKFNKIIAAIKSELKVDGFVSVSFEIQQTKPGRIIWKIKGSVMKPQDDTN